MNAYTVNGPSIPDSKFSCPTNYTGTDYVNIPWSSMSIDHGEGQNHTDGYYYGICGIKGPHPRMATCCQNGQLQPINYPNASIYLSAEDHCSQYCNFYLAIMDLWLYCLTKEGNSVVNAFCRSDDGTFLQTSGSLPRDGPFDPDNALIKDKKKLYSSAGKSARVSLSLVLISSLLVLVFI